MESVVSYSGSAGENFAGNLAEHTPVLNVSCADKLDQLAVVRDSLRQMQEAKQAFIDRVLSEHADDLASFDVNAEQLAGMAAGLEADIKSEVLSRGTTIKGRRIQAVWSKPRESWDSKLLQGFAIAYPEIMQARKVGEASVSFRAVTA